VGQGVDHRRHQWVLHWGRRQPAGSWWG
jgi:hypothetical protein